VRTRGHPCRDISAQAGVVADESARQSQAQVLKWVDNNLPFENEVTATLPLSSVNECNVYTDATCSDMLVISSPQIFWSCLDALGYWDGAGYQGVERMRKCLQHHNQASTKQDTSPKSMLEPWNKSCLDAVVQFGIDTRTASDMCAVYCFQWRQATNSTMLYTNTYAMKNCAPMEKPCS